MSKSFRIFLILLVLVVSLSLTGILMDADAEKPASKFGGGWKECKLEAASKCPKGTTSFKDPETKKMMVKCKLPDLKKLVCGKDNDTNCSCFIFVKAKPSPQNKNPLWEHPNYSDAGPIVEDKKNNDYDCFCVRQ